MSVHSRPQNTLKVFYTSNYNQMAFIIPRSFFHELSLAIKKFHKNNHVSLSSFYFIFQNCSEQKNQ